MSKTVYFDLLLDNIVRICYLSLDQARKQSVNLLTKEECPVTNKQNVRREPLWTPAFTALFFMNMLTCAGFYMTSPTLPKYAVSVGMSLAMAGVLTGIFSIVAIFVRPVIGAASDRTSGKTILVTSTLVTSLAALGYSRSTTTVALFLCRILHGACFAASSTVQLAITSTLLPESRMAEGMGQMGISSILAMTFAPNLGLTLSESLGYEKMFLVSAALIATAGVGMLFLPVKPAPTAPQSGKLDFRAMFLPKLFLISVIGALFSLMNGVVSSFLSMLGDERGIANVGLFFTVSSLAVLTIRPFIGQVIDRKGLYFVLFPSLILGALAMVCIGSSWGIVPVIAASILKGVSQSSGQTAVQAECAKRSRPEQRGVAMATYYLGSDLGNSVGSSLGGWLSQSVGYGGMFHLTGALVAGGVLLTALQLRKDKSREDCESSSSERKSCA